MRRILMVVALLLGCLSVPGFAQVRIQVGWGYPLGYPVQVRVHRHPDGTLSYQYGAMSFFDPYGYGPYALYAYGPGSTAPDDWDDSSYLSYPSWEPYPAYYFYGTSLAWPWSYAGWSFHAWPTYYYRSNGWRQALPPAGPFGPPGPHHQSPYPGTAPGSHRPPGWSTGYHPSPAGGGFTVSHPGGFHGSHGGRR